jgi:serine/threonine-protein kinase HipA
MPASWRWETIADQLRSAQVLFKGRVAGTLVETVAGGTRFAYADEWRQDIACSFPVTRREHDWANGLHPFFQHIGPEGWLRQEQARGAHIQGDDDLGLLLRYGADCIGAVSIVPLENEAVQDEISEAGPSPGRTVSGVQKKLLAVKTRDGYAPAGPDGPAPYIAKFNSESLTTLVQNENRCLKWTAELLGKREVTQFSLGQIAGDIALIVTRFDREANGEKLRLEDFAQILQQPRGNDYNGKYQSSYEAVAEGIQKHSARPIIDLQRFYERLIAFALIGNCDAHLKNFSLLEQPEGLRLSPTYDVLSTAVYESFERVFGLTIDGKRRYLDELDGRQLKDFGQSIGIKDAAIEQTFEKLKRQVPKAAIHIRPPDAEAPDGLVNRIAEIVSNQCVRILGN